MWKDERPTKRDLQAAPRARKSKSSFPAEARTKPTKRPVQLIPIRNIREETAANLPPDSRRDPD
jgi:hypothetical protein